jgi:amino acid transporter
VNALAFVFVVIFGADNTFFTWANMITLALIFMYVLANIGVMKYYLTEGRAQFNPILHIVVPVVATVAGGLVVWKSYFSPLPSPFTGPVAWGLMCFLVLVLVTIVILLVLKVRGNEEWLQKAQLVFEGSAGGH